MAGKTTERPPKRGRPKTATLPAPILDTRKKTFSEIISDVPRPGFNSLGLAVLSSVVLALLGFTAIEIPNPVSALIMTTQDQINATGWFQTLAFHPQDWMVYSFQLPFALFVGALLGGRLGMLTVFLYVIAGLFVWPLFANGGGPTYTTQPGFCYWVAIWVGTGLAGYINQQALTHRSAFRRSLLVYTQGISSVLITHALAILFVVSQSLILGRDISTLGQLVNNLSLAPLLYDMLATSTFLWFVRYIRLAFYPALYD